MHTTKPTNSLKCVYKQRKDATWLGNEPQSSFAFLPEWIFHYILWKLFKKTQNLQKDTFHRHHVYWTEAGII